MSRHNLKSYVALLKPGIIRANALAAVAGYLLASGTHIKALSLLGLFSGIALIISSACIFNNYFDRDMDKKMERTKKRPFVEGTVNVQIALSIAFILLLLGISSMLAFTNLLALALALVGFIVYVLIYTPLKKRSVHGTLIGAISGAMPPAAGYVAYTHTMNRAPLLLILILVFWQMPHFFAIAMYRLDDYKKAKTPVMPVVNGTAATKLVIILYTVGLIYCCAALTLFGYAGWSFLIIMTALNITWFYKGLAGYKKLDDKTWGKQMFLFSLIIISSLSVMLALGNILP